MGAICIYPNKISRLVTYTHNHDRRPCKRWDTPGKDLNRSVFYDELWVSTNPLHIRNLNTQSRYRPDTRLLIAVRGAGHRTYAIYECETLDLSGRRKTFQYGS